MISTVFFDLDETLMNFHYAEAQALRGALSQQGIPPTDAIAARYSAINQNQWARLERREITRQQVLYERFDLLFAELGVEKSSFETQNLYEQLLGSCHVLLPGAKELLDTLYGKYPLYLASNGTAAVQDRRLHDSGLERYFENIFISERVGADKPSRAFFDKCFAAIPDFRREEAIIIGDSLTSDILGGINAGIRTCWFNPKEKAPNPGIPADYEIHTLEALPQLLSTL